MGGMFAASIDSQNAQMITYYALYALQHRGEYGCGLAADYNGYIDYKKGYGLVTSVLDKNDLKLLRGKTALGHVSNSQKEIPLLELDPKVLGFKKGAMALCFDGNLLNFDELKAIVDKAGITYENNSHTEIVGNLIALNYNGSLIDAVKKTLKLIKGAYSILIMHDDIVVATRDPFGIKPLVMGKTDNGTLFSSETCAFDAVGADFIREVRPGEIIEARANDIRSEQYINEKCSKSCIFEPIYTARPDSIVDGLSIYLRRLRAGKMLGKANDVQADVIIAAPDSGTVYAIGYAQESHIPYGMGIIKNRYVGRTFIEKGNEERINKVKIKLNALKEVIDGKNVVVVDDSIVRGTTMLRTVKMLRNAGAKSVHVRVASPMVFYECKIGVNESVSGKMLAADHDLEDIRKVIEADSLEYITIEDMLEAFGGKDHFCTGCINNEYPIDMEGKSVNRL